MPVETSEKWLELGFALLLILSHVREKLSAESKSEERRTKWRFAWPGIVGCGGLVLGAGLLSSGDYVTGSFLLLFVCYYWLTVMAKD